ncbi:MAG: ThuA domain-containing protein [Sphingobacteriaceae bacterium]
MMKKTIKFLVLLIMIVHVSSLAFSSEIKGKMKQKTKAVSKKMIVFIPGYNSHGSGEHEYVADLTLMAELLNKYVPNVEAVVTKPGWPADTSILDKADAIVMFCDGGESHIAIPHLDHLDKLMKKGVGLVNIHYAVEVPAGKTGDYFLKWTGGIFEINWSVNPFWNASFKNFPKHDITNGVKPFEIKDEWYYHMRFTKDTKHLTPILKLVPPPSTLDRKDGTHEGNPAVRASIAKGEQQVLAWAYERNDGGRAFGFTGGHMHKNWRDDNFRKLLLNAITWSAKLTVPKNGVDTPTPTQADMDAMQKKP